MKLFHFFFRKCKSERGNTPTLAATATKATSGGSSASIVGLRAATTLLAVDKNLALAASAALVLLAANLRVNGAASLDVLDVTNRRPSNEAVVLKLSAVGATARGTREGVVSKAIGALAAIATHLVANRHGLGANTLRVHQKAHGLRVATLAIAISTSSRVAALGRSSGEFNGLVLNGKRAVHGQLRNKVGYTVEVVGHQDKRIRHGTIRVLAFTASHTTRSQTTTCNISSTTASHFFLKFFF